MHPTLFTLIERFREAQDRGVRFIVEVLGPTLGVRLPTCGRDWLRVCGETGLYNVRWMNGVEIYTHGFGIELTFSDLHIDFDFGDNGEPDGFDGWRLHFFAWMNKLDPCPDSPQCWEWLEQAHAAGELTKDVHLYYSPAHRVTS